MDIAYLSLLVFLLITVVYFFIPSIGKIPLTLQNVSNLDEYAYTNLPRLGLYFLMIVIAEFAVNALYLVNKCGGNVGPNIGAAFAFTIIPYVFIFGVMIAVLVMFPGLKSAFSDVIGYFVVSSKANDIFTQILVDTDVREAMNGMADGANKDAMEKSAEAVMKMFGNKSILINKLTTTNFESLWGLLRPLMKQNVPDLDAKKAELFDLAVLRENIGEALWYIYSGILVSSIVSYKISSRPCVKSLSSIKSDHDAYVEKQAAIDKQNKLNNSTEMVM